MKDFATSTDLINYCTVNNLVYEVETRDVRDTSCTYRFDIWPQGEKEGFSLHTQEFKVSWED